MNTRQSTKEAAVIAWECATRDKIMSDLLKAIGAVILSMTDDDQSFRSHRDTYRFSKRIATATEHGQLGALGYMQNWTGEWEVRNKDLVIVATFAMWLHRYSDPHSAIPQSILGPIQEALKRKRLQQAYDRYQKTGLTREHCALLRSAIWEVDVFRGDWVSIFIQGKRPFGDSSITSQIYRLVGWPADWPEDEGMSEDQEERAWNLFDELIFAATDAAKLAGANLANTKVSESPE